MLRLYLIILIVTIANCFDNLEYYEQLVKDSLEEVRNFKKPTDASEYKAPSTPLKGNVKCII